MEKCERNGIRENEFFGYFHAVNQSLFQLRPVEFYGRDESAFDFISRSEVVSIAG